MYIDTINTSFKYLYIIVAFGALSSCIDYKVNSKGHLAPEIQYSLSSLHFIGRHRTMFSGIIKKQKVIQEKIVYFTDLASPPIKVLFTFDSTKKIYKKDLFIAVLNTQSEIQLTDVEKQLLKIMSNKNFKDDFTEYNSISGFRKSTSTDNIPTQAQNYNW